MSNTDNSSNLTGLRLNKIYCVIDSGYNRCSVSFKTKEDAQLTCDNFNEHVHEDHTVAEFNITDMHLHKNNETTQDN